MKKGLNSFFFTLGFEVAMALYASIDIYLFNHYEYTQGKGGTFIFALVYTLVGTVLVSVGFRIGIAVFPII